MAATNLYNLARMTSATTGTGTITLVAAVTSFLTFDQAGVTDGQTVRYAIEDANGTGREIGYGVYTTATKELTRNVESSTNSNNAIDLSGTEQVFITESKRDFPWVVDSGNTTATINFTVTPSSNDGAALGTNDLLQWSDFFLASGGVVGWNGSSAAFTHNAALPGVILSAGKFRISDTTDASSAVLTGALQVSGGVYIGKKMYVYDGINTFTQGMGDVTLMNIGVNATADVWVLKYNTATGVTAMGANASIGDLDIFTTANGNINISPAGAGQIIGTRAITALSTTTIPAGGTAGAGYKFSATSNYGVFFGSGAPTLAAAQGSIYLRSDGTSSNNRAYLNVAGSTIWTAILTSS